MRYVILGAGAVGCVIGAALQATGHSVTLIARGKQLEALRLQKNVTLVRPAATTRHPVDVVGTCEEARLAATDVVILTVKSQAAEAALRDLAAVAPRGLAVVCAQNGVECERMAVRRFDNVHAMLNLLPATLIEPGVVLAPVGPMLGVLDIGRYPAGRTELDTAIADDLSRSGFSSQARDNVMRWKYGKLVQSATTAARSLCAPGPDRDRLVDALAEEASACLKRCGIACASAQELDERRRGVMDESASGHAGRPSIDQSLERLAGEVEIAFFNGEFRLLGALNGFDCPLNAAMMELGERVARHRLPPRSLSAADVFESARLSS